MRVAAMAAIGLLVLPCLSVLPAGGGESRVKDVVRLEDAVRNTLMGEGLVVGLAGTGDKSARTKKLALRLYKEMSGTLFDLADLDSKNIALVHVTAELPPFLARGDRIDVTVSSTEGASSLKGGILVHANLVGPGTAERKPVIALASGAVVLGAERPAGGRQAGASVHPTVGRIPGGGLVLDPDPGAAQLVRDGRVALSLQSPDFANAQRVAETINAEFAREAGEDLARAVSMSRIEVAVPQAYRDAPAAFVSRVLEIPVTLIQPKAQVRVNPTSGSITVCGDPLLSAAQVYFGQGVRVSVPDGCSLSKLLADLNDVTTPEQKIEVLQKLHDAGALRAEWVVE